MSNQPSTTTIRIGMVEFIFLMASLMSVVALSIDAVLPALGFMAQEFNVGGSEVQLVITSLFAGFAIGQLIYGPVSDRVGRLPGIYVGFGFFYTGLYISNVRTVYRDDAYWAFFTGHRRIWTTHYGISLSKRLF